jgi:hypothetical protein
LPSCGSDYSLIELASLSDPVSGPCPEISATVPASSRCCAHLSVFNHGFTIDPVAAKHRRVCDAPTPVAGERRRSKSWRAFGRTCDCRHRACSAASTWIARASWTKQKDFRKRHSTFQQPARPIVRRDGRRPRIGRFSTCRSGDPHRPRIYGAHQDQRIITTFNVPGIGAS